MSEVAGYVNHENSVYDVSLLALLFLFLSCCPSSVLTVVVFWSLRALHGGIFTRLLLPSSLQTIEYS